MSRPRLLTSCSMSRARPLVLTGLAAAALMLGACQAKPASNDASAATESADTTAAFSPAAQTAFAAPEDAVVALIDACRTGEPAALEPLFGVKCAVFASGNPEQVGMDMQRLAAAYDRDHVLITEDDGSVTLWIGPRQWAFPAPLIKGERGWTFDTVTAGAVMRSRAMDDNEAAAARMAFEMADAQSRFKAMNLPGFEGAFTARLASTPGNRDGLFWNDDLGEPRSPLGVVADAVAAGAMADDADAKDRPGTYRGYRFRVLTSQGPAAPGGAMTFTDAQGRLTRGFAIIAWPDRYDADGRSVFMVGPDGTVYERDFGDAAGADEHTPPVDSFDPTPDWTVYPIER